MSGIFDLDALGRSTGLSKAKVRALIREVRKEFPGHELLLELHVVRAIMHGRDLEPQQVTART